MSLRGRSRSAAKRWFSEVLRNDQVMAGWLSGREILFDSGGGSYEQSKWRNYELSTFGHNTVLVDGKPQERQTADAEANVSKSPIDALWQSNPTYDYAVGVYDEGYGSITSRIAQHTRGVLFIKPDLAVVVDTLTPADALQHTYQARWNLNSTHTVLDPSTSAVTTQDAGRPNLAVIPLQMQGLAVQAISAQTTPELLGWYVFKDHTPAEVPATTVLHTISGAGVQNLVTLLVPLRPGAPLPVDEVRQSTLNAWKIHFKDGRQLSVFVDPNDAGAIRLSGTLPDGSAGRQIEIPSTQRD
jgi:hypothetical protein